MIQKMDLHEVSDFSQSPGQPDILFRWKRIPARMIVHDQNIRCSRLQRTHENITRRAKRCVYGSDRHNLFPDQHILLIQKKQKHLFLLLMAE